MFSKMSGCALCTLNLISCWYANKLFNLRLFVILLLVSTAVLLMKKFHCSRTISFCVILVQFYFRAALRIDFLNLCFAKSGFSCYF